MNHSYEEIRRAVLDVLSGREGQPFRGKQYNDLSSGTAAILHERQAGQKEDWRSKPIPQLSKDSGNLFLEVFWDLFRQGIITLGNPDASRCDFPFFRVTHFGERLLATSNTYFFHDVASYKKLVKENIPRIDSGTLVYVQEAMQAFQSGCILSATVMIGVASEHSFLKLLEAASTSKKYGSSFQTALGERTILGKITKFKNALGILDQQQKILTRDLKEGFDTNFPNFSVGANH